MDSRKLYCVANFKMNMRMIDVINYFVELHKMHKTNLKDGDIYDLSDIIICPSFTTLAAYGAVIGNLVNKEDFFNEGDSVALLGAQNINIHNSGAYTGEISAEMIQDHSVTHVILGHSERREYFSETNEEINKKINTALKSGLISILCIGETLEEREKGLTNNILEEQLKKCLLNIKDDNLIVAYEPVWAIGTGKNADLPTITEAHKVIRNILNDIGFDGEKISILYGGSVNKNNANELISLNNVDGFLIGGASLDVKHFYDIYKIIEEFK